MPDGFAHGHGGGHRHIERAQPLSHRNAQPRVGRRVPLLGHSRGFPAKQQDVAALEYMRKIGAGRAGGEEKEPRGAGRQASNAAQSA